MGWTPTRIADGSGHGHRLDAACVRALEAWMDITRKADELLDLLDNVTSPGVVRARLSDDDSLVIALRDGTSNKS